MAFCQTNIIVLRISYSVSRKEKDIRKIWESNKRIAIICGCIQKKEDKK